MDTVSRRVSSPVSKPARNTDVRNTLKISLYLVTLGPINMNLTTVPQQKVSALILPLVRNLLAFSYPELPCKEKTVYVLKTVTAQLGQNIDKCFIALTFE